MELPEALAREVDALLREGRDLDAVRRVRDRLGVGLGEAASRVDARRARIQAPLPSAGALEGAAVAALPRAPAALGAAWDGDSGGWFVVLEARDAAGMAVWQASLRAPGGDARLFRGEVPPWPEEALAREVGGRLAARWGVPFAFEPTGGPTVGPELPAPDVAPPVAGDRRRARGV